jgi:hypothetical protein
VFDVVVALEDIVKTGAWKGISELRGAVT